ncbi:permease prefix domain 1-containing protein [Agathobacter sp.]
METIKNYLENMFSRLPNTPEVQKAKYELYQMMEDKYNELISEGKSDNEAVGVVISEFGNLDELADSLGIKSFINPQPSMPAAKTLSREAAADFLKSHSKHAFLTAFGVLLCIISCVVPIFSDAMPDSFVSSDVSDAVGVTLLLVCIAFAVGLFIISNSLMGKWDFLKKEPYCIDFEAAKWLHEQKESYRTTHSILLTLGIMLCILCAVPPVLLSSINHGNRFLDSLSGALVLIFIAFGVFLIVCTSMRKSGFDKLLRLNGSKTVGGNFVPSQKDNVHFDNPVINAIMSVYWPTITCIYLAVSFLTFDWHITWIIWPIAAIVSTLINNLLGQDDE